MALRLTLPRVPVLSSLPPHPPPLSYCNLLGRHRPALSPTTPTYRHSPLDPRSPPMSPSKEPRLPLIRCPICNVGAVKWFVSRTAKNPGRHFYRCEYQGKGCSFWKWEDEYADYLRTRWGHIWAVPAVKR